MKPKEIPLLEGKYYHIYNRGNNKDKLFFTSENYKYFLRKYDDYLSNYIDTYAYCLLPNHFHLLVSVKETIEFPSKAPSFKKEKLSDGTAAALISLQFRKFFTSYAMSINKQEGRTGSLFQKNFKRKEITNSRYLTNLVFYIHANPQLHGIIKDFTKHSWNSYNSILMDKPTKLKKALVLNWFENKENFIAYHSKKINMIKIKDFIIENDE